MKRILVAAFVALAATFSTSADAQSFLSGFGFGQEGYGQYPFFNGFEAGLQGGFAWGRSSGRFLEGPTALLPLEHYSFRPSGGLGGLHLGYDFQPIGTPLVIGAIGDIEGGSVTGRRTSFANDAAVGTRLNFDASIRGRVGWAFGPILPYATGGLAIGNVRTRFFEPIGVLAAGGSSTRTGYTIGAGLAYAVTPNWEVNVEYRYVNLGSDQRIVDGGIVPPATGLETNNLFRYNIITAGLTYRFAPPAPPPAPLPAAAPAPPPPPPPRTFLVFFDFDRYNLTPDARRVIEAAAAAYKATGSARLEVSGHTDLAGTAAYNMRLSRRRADTVAAALARDGVPRSAMDVKWFGKERPRVPTPDGVREPQNRRVEIVME